MRFIFQYIPSILTNVSLLDFHEYNVPMQTRRRIGQGKGGGRPPSITPVKSAKLLAALENGFSLNESLYHAEISDDSYRRLLDKSSKFRGEVAAAKLKLVMAAKSKIAQAVNSGDMPTVRWFLERKCPEEFRFAKSNDGYDNPLPEGTVIVLPGSKPHPRILPERVVKSAV